MDILKFAAEQFIRAAGNNAESLDVSKVAGSLGSLLSGKDGQLDLAGIVMAFRSRGLGNLVSSWLGDGANEPISVNNIIEVFGQTKLTQFAKGLNLDSSTASQGLAAALPALLDKGSEGGALMNMASGALGSLRKMF